MPSDKEKQDIAAFLKQRQSGKSSPAVRKAAAAKKLRNAKDKNKDKPTLAERINFGGKS